MVITPIDKIKVPDGTPAQISYALQIANSCQFFSALNDLKEENENKYSIEAEISSELKPLGIKQSPKYRVKFLIPKFFPFQLVSSIPINPALKWYPHQYGDWLTDANANIICQPRLEDITIEELLIPYIRYAYKWINDAKSGKLIKADEKYEFPHIIVSSKGNKIAIYIEGGHHIHSWIKATKYGVAYVNVIEDYLSDKNILCIVKSIRNPQNEGINETAEMSIGDPIVVKKPKYKIIPWFFAGNPVVGLPHKPLTKTNEIPLDIKRVIFDSIKLSNKYCNKPSDILPIWLAAFEIPDNWGGTPDIIIWQAIQVNRTLIEKPRGFRPNTHPSKWPALQQFLRSNNKIEWLKIRNISPKTLKSRAGHNVNILDDMSFAIIGIGALGSIIAKSLFKTQPKNLLLIDKELLEPGNLIRHEANFNQVEKAKAKAVESILIPSSNNSNIKGIHADIINDWGKIKTDLQEIDIIIDASGNHFVHEKIACSNLLREKIIAYCYFKPGPDYGVLFLRKQGSYLSLKKAEERLKNDIEPTIWEHFSGYEKRKEGINWPEPGCYHPTFEAPYHRIRMIADAFLVTLLSWIQDECPTNVITLYQQKISSDTYGINQKVLKQIKID